MPQYIKEASESDIQSKSAQTKTPQKVTSSNNSTKAILLLLFCAGITLLGDAIYENFQINTKKDTNHLELLSQDHFVSRDMYELDKSGKIPSSFFHLKNIKWSYYDTDLQKQIPEKSLPFKTSPDGDYDLEVDAFSSPQKTGKIVILQMSLIDDRTKNKIFELSRNYEIK
jgi:hypothetical protein